MGSDFSSDRNFGLDLVRSLAIVMVVAGHAGPFFIYGDYAKRVLEFGGFGVELFFVLSGFLIGSILLKMSKKPITGAGLRYFWMRRWLRTLPAYYIALAFAFYAKGVFDPSYLAFLQMPVNGNANLMTVSWSLAIEEWFYLLFPLACVILSRLGVRHLYIVLTAAFLLLPTGLRVAQFFHPEFASWGGGVRGNLLRFDTIGMGALLAWLLSRSGWKAIANQHRSTILVIAAIGVGALIAHHLLTIGGVYVVPRWYSLVFSYNVQALVWSAVVVAAYHAIARPHEVIALPIQFVSKISYSTYLWHIHFLWIGRWLFPGQRGYFVFLAGTVIAVFGPAALYYVTELPFLWLRDRISERWRRSDQPLAPTIQAAPAQ